MSLIYGLVTGILFGFLLQKGHVLKYDKRVGAIRLMDMTIFKFILSAIIVAAIGIYFLKDLGLIQLSMKSTKHIFINWEKEKNMKMLCVRPPKMFTWESMSRCRFNTFIGPWTFCSSTPM